VCLLLLLLLLVVLLALLLTRWTQHPSTVCLHLVGSACTHQQQAQLAQHSCLLRC
jgi:hypothetical protein